MKNYHVLIVLFVLLIIIGAVLLSYSRTTLSIFGISRQEYFIAYELILILAFGLMIIKALSSSIIAYGKRKPRMDEQAVAKIVSLLGYTILVILLLTFLRVNVTGIIVGAGFLGIVVGLASQPVLGNLFAGISMMAAKPFVIGDRITFSTWQYGMLPPSHAHSIILPGYSGVIQELGIMYSRMRLDDGTALFVPNGILNQAAIINYGISENININVRVELGIQRRFEAFVSETQRGINSNKRLAKALKGSASIKITNVDVSNYGVNISANVKIADELYAREELAKIAVRAAAKGSK